MEFVWDDATEVVKGSESDRVREARVHGYTGLGREKAPGAC